MKEQASRERNVSPTDNEQSGAGKYLTFSLAAEEYGIAIMKVKEVVGMLPIRPLLQTPEFIRGVINLRGQVIPVMDLRLRFEMEERKYHDRTCIIIYEAQAAQMISCWDTLSCGKSGCPAFGHRDRRCWMMSGTFCRDEIQGSYYEKISACRKCTFHQNVEEKRLVFPAGIIVDGVSEVVLLKEEDIVSTPRLGNQSVADFILGVGKRKDRVIFLLDMDGLLNTGQIEHLRMAPVEKSEPKVVPA